MASASRIFFTILNKNNTTKTLTASVILARTRAYCFSANPVQRNNLYSKIIVLGKRSCNVAPVLQRWVKEGNHLNEFQLKHLIRDLRSRKRFSHALEVSKWMSSSGLKFSSSDCALQLELIYRVHGISSADNFFSSLREQDKNVQTYGALLSCYVQKGLIDESLSLVKKMKEMGFLSTPLNYNSLMSLYAKTGQFGKVPDVLSEMKMNGVSPDSFSYRICINSYGARADYNSVEKVLQEMENQRHIQMDSEWSTYSIVANYYIKAGLNEKALHYLKESEKRVGKDALGYEHLITLYASLGNKHEMKRLWDLQKANCKQQTNKNYVSMLGSLVKLDELEEAEKLLEEWELLHKNYDFRVPNVLLIRYCQKGLVEKAEEKLKDIIKRKQTAAPNSWSILATGYVDKNNMEKAFECFKEALGVQAQNKGWRPKAHLISNILSWLGENKVVAEVEAFVKLLLTKVPTNREMYHALLKAHLRNGKDVQTLLEGMKADNIDEDEETMKILSLGERNS